MSSSAYDEAGKALDGLVTDVPDFPEPGIVFKDITPLLADPDGFAVVSAALAEAGRDDQARTTVDAVVGMEARGFLFGPVVARELGVGFVPVRKGGKLPRATYEVTYQLEYGEARLALHRDALGPGQRVLLVDDLLATGGTVNASRQLVARCGASVEAVAVLLELGFLDGRSALGDVPVHALRTV